MTTANAVWQVQEAKNRFSEVIERAQREADEVGGEGSTHTDLIILTHEAREGAMNAALAQLQGLPSVLAPIVRIRKEELN